MIERFMVDLIWCDATLFTARAAGEIADVSPRRCSFEVLQRARRRRLARPRRIGVQRPRARGIGVPKRRA
jgi:hypothetical protein